MPAWNTINPVNDIVKQSFVDPTPAKCSIIRVCGTNDYQDITQVVFTHFAVWDHLVVCKAKLSCLLSHCNMYGQNALYGIIVQPLHVAHFLWSCQFRDMCLDLEGKTSMKDALESRPTTKMIGEKKNLLFMAPYVSIWGETIAHPLYVLDDKGCSPT